MDCRSGEDAVDGIQSQEAPIDLELSLVPGPDVIHGRVSEREVTSAMHILTRKVNVCQRRTN